MRGERCCFQGARSLAPRAPPAGRGAGVRCPPLVPLVRPSPRPAPPSSGPGPGSGRPGRRRSRRGAWWVRCAGKGREGVREEKGHRAANGGRRRARVFFVPSSHLSPHRSSPANRERSMGVESGCVRECACVGVGGGGGGVDRVGIDWESGASGTEHRAAARCGFFVSSDCPSLGGVSLVFFTLFSPRGPARPRPHLTRITAPSCPAAAARPPRRPAPPSWGRCPPPRARGSVPRRGGGRMRLAPLAHGRRPPPRAPRPRPPCARRLPPLTT